MTEIKAFCLADHERTFRGPFAEDRAMLWLYGPHAHPEVDGATKEELRAVREGHVDNILNTLAKAVLLFAGGYIFAHVIVACATV